MHVLTAPDASEIAARPALRFQLSVVGDAPPPQLPEDTERMGPPRH